jgi:hydrogenase nickel incorporation protein HypA/HybF
MHELSISRALVDAASARSGGRQVVRLSVRAGVLRQVVPETLAWCLEIVARGTACEGAALDCVRVPLRLRCACAHEWSLAGAEPCFRCPACGGSEVEVLSGEELSLDWIEVVEPGEPAGLAQQLGSERPHGGAHGR